MSGQSKLQSNLNDNNNNNDIIGNLDMPSNGAMAESKQMDAKPNITLFNFGFTKNAMQKPQSGMNISSYNDNLNFEIPDFHLNLPNIDFNYESKPIAGSLSSQSQQLRLIYLFVLLQMCVYDFNFRFVDLNVTSLRYILLVC